MSINLDELHQLAEQGDVQAQTTLGWAFAKGSGIEQDLFEAMKWFRKAAETGDRFGQWAVGFLYAKGLGVPQDYIAAKDWFLKAAEQGDAESAYSLGLMYEEGMGVTKDILQAEEWFRRASFQGHKPASERLQIYMDAKHSVEAMARRIQEQSKPNTEISVEGGPGGAPETAFVIKGARNNLEGVEAEYAVLERILGKEGKDWEVVSRSLVKLEGTPFDQYQVRSSNGKERFLFFDVTHFMGYT
jgi:hypothetical protein